MKDPKEQLQSLIDVLDALQRVDDPDFPGELANGVRTLAKVCIQQQDWIDRIYWDFEEYKTLTQQR